MWRQRRRVTTRLLSGVAILLALALVPAVPASTQTSGSLRVAQVSAKVFGDTVQLAVVANGSLAYRTVQMSSPPQLVIDLPGATLESGVSPLIEVGQGGVARVRVGQFQTNPAMVRVAVELDRVMPFTLSTISPTVLVAKFASRANAQPAQPTQPMAAVQPAAPLPPAQPESVQVAQAAPGPLPAPLAQAPATPSTRINIEFRNTELADVLSALAKACAVNIVTDTSVKGQVTVRLLDLSCDEALRFILEANNLAFRRLGRNLIIMSADRLAPPPVAPESITYPVGFAVAKDIADIIRNAIPGLRVTSDQRSNTVVVLGTAAQHDEVRKIMAGLDVQLAQVAIEVRCVDVAMSDLAQLGLNWGLAGIPVTTIRGIFPNQVIVGVPTTSFNIILDAMVTAKKARVITAPRVLVVDGNEATINLGQEVPIPETDANGRVTYTFKPVGVLMTILPKVNRDGLITTKVEPEVSSVLEFLPAFPGQVPVLSSRRASTTVTVRSGEPIVMGGLIASEERRTVVKVPFLGDIPILGALFRTTTTDRRESEIIFVVTPQLVPPQGAPATPRP